MIIKEIIIKTSYYIIIFAINDKKISNLLIISFLIDLNENINIDYKFRD